MYFMIIGIIVISVIGTLSHFLYDITKHNKIVGLFTAVNESTWEHIKIAVIPTILWGLIDGCVYGINYNYFFAKFVSLIAIIILIPLLFYGYMFLFKKNNEVINVLIFYLVIIISQYLFTYLISVSSVNYLLGCISCIGICFVFACCIIFTFMPGKNFMFKDPISNKYGFDGHTEILHGKKNGEKK